ncbi:hypothetical protein AB0G02_36705, partial [Actinosynnema sp. NPDC023658]|uniref:hypothetical protein n=1 Tax=Actinosynnema sp. NPDC023658 TaxID=3155465 RepID=UPI0034044A3C
AHPMKLDWDRVDDAVPYTGDTTPPTSTYAGDTPDLDGSVPQPPRTTGPTGATVVNTEALKTFARNLRRLKELLVEALDKVRRIQLAPGAFYHAGQLVGKVTGPGGLAPSVEEFLLKAIDALEVTALDLERLAHDYDTTEELNGLTAVKLDEHIQDAMAYIGKTTGLQVNGLGEGSFDPTQLGLDRGATGGAGGETTDPDADPDAKD